MLKRLIDILGAAIGLLVLSPALLIVAWLIAKEMGTPILFRQIRPGLHGKPFKMIKFRTMRDAVETFGQKALKCICFLG